MNYLTEMMNYIKDNAYKAMSSGLKTILPGATGTMYSNSLTDQRNASRSQLKMRKERGSLRTTGVRRMEKYAMCMAKRANSYCNNLENPVVVKRLKAA